MGAAADVNSGRSGRAPHPSTLSTRRHPAELSSEFALRPGPSLNLVLRNSFKYLSGFNWGCLVNDWCCALCKVKIFYCNFVYSVGNILVLDVFIKKKFFLRPTVD